MTNSRPRRDTVKRLYEANRFLDAYGVTQEAWSQSALLEVLGAADLVLAGRLARRLGSDALARVLFRRAKSRFPEDHEVTFYARYAADDRKTVHDALAAYERRPHLGSDRADLETYWCADRALWLAVVRDFTRASACIEEARELGGDATWVDTCEAEVLFRQDRWNEALELAEAAWSTSPGMPHAAWILALTLAALGRPGEAARRLLECSNTLPQSWEVLELGLHYAIDAVTHDDRSVLEHLPGGILAGSERLDALAPLADSQRRRRFACLRAEAARLEGDRAALVEHARKAHTFFYTKVAENMSRQSDGERVILRHEKVRQRHNTCLPASVVACASAFGEDVSHDELVSAVTYDGTAKWRIADWAAQNGWGARSFLGEGESCLRLLRAGFPFIFTLRAFNFSHAVAAVGFDEAMGTLIYHDPSSSRQGEILLDSLDDNEAPFGPDCLALAPPSRRAALEAIELSGEAFATADLRLIRAVEAGSLADAREVISEFQRSSPDDDNVAFLRARLDRFDGRPRDAIRALVRLLDRHSACHLVQTTLLGASQATGDTAAYRRVLGSIATREPLPGIDGSREWIRPEPVLIARYADLLSASAEHEDEALALLNKALYRGPYDAETYHYLADVLWTSGRHEEALLPYRIASCLDTSHEHYADAYAWGLRKCGRARDGIAWLRSRVDALDSEAGGGDAWATLVTVQRDFGFPEEALATLREGLESRPEDADLAAFAVGFFAGFGRFDEAEKALETCERRGAPGAFYCASHDLARRRGDSATALRHAREWLAERPLSSDARRAVHELVLQIDGEDEALALLDSWLADRPEDADIELMHLEFIQSLSKGGSRVAALKARVKRNPLDGWAWRELGFELVSELEKLPAGKLDAGLARLRRVVSACERVDPNRPATLALRAELHVLEHDEDGAIACYGRALEKSPDYSYAINRMFALAVNRPLESRRSICETIDRAFSAATGQLAAARTAAFRIAEQFGRETAVEWLRRWDAVSPDDPQVLEAWADMLLSHGLGRETAEDLLPKLDRMVKKFPLHLGLAYSLADTYRVLTRLDDAIACYRRVLEHRPAWTQARSALARTLELTGDRAGAVAELRLAIDHDRRDHGLWMRLADLLCESGDAVSAERVLDEAIEILPSVMNLWERRIELLEQLGRPQEAIAVARELAERYPEGAYAQLVLAVAYRRADAEVSRDMIDTAFKSAIRLNARLWDAAWEYSMWLCDQREFERARAVVEAYLALEKDDIFARGGLAVIERRADRRNEAFQAMATLVREHPDYEYGWRCVLDWIEADQVWDRGRALLELPDAGTFDDPELACRRLDVLKRCGVEAEKIDADWRRLVDNWPASRVVNLWYFDELVEAGRLSDATDVLDAFSRYEPDSPATASRRCVLAARQGDRAAALEHAALVLGYQGHDMPNTARTTVEALESIEAVEEAAAGVARSLERKERVTPSCMQRLAGALGRATSRAGFHALVDALGRDGFEWDSAGALATVLTAYAESREGASLVTLWGEQHRDGLARDTRIWQAVGRAFSVLDDHRGTVAWMRDWREWSTVELWAMSNYTSACFELGRYRECIDTCSECLERCSWDYTAPYLVEHILRSALELDDGALFVETIDRWSDALASGDRSVEHRVLDALAEVLRPTRGVSLADLHTSTRSARKKCAWVTPHWRREVSRRLPFLRRLLFLCGLWGA